jgi:N-methylhydantoinase A
MLFADLRHDYVRTVFRALAELDMAEVLTMQAELIDTGRATLIGEDVAISAMEFEPFLDVRYVGQEFTLSVPVTESILRDADREAIRSRYDEMHARRYGHHGQGEPVEVVNLRVIARGRRERARRTVLSAALDQRPVGARDVFLADPDVAVSCPIYVREVLEAGREIAGPAIIEEYASTTVLFPGDVATVLPDGELLVRTGTRR